MCFWHLKFSNPSCLIALPTVPVSVPVTCDVTEAEGGSTATKTAAEASDNFDAREVGLKLLRLYLEIVLGPLKGHGWREERATELLAYIELYDATVKAASVNVHVNQE